MKYELDIGELYGRMDRNIRDVLIRDESRWRAELEKILREAADQFITQYMMSISFRLIQLTKAENPLSKPEFTFRVETTDAVATKEVPAPPTKPSILGRRGND